LASRGPQNRNIGYRELRMMLTAVRRLCGQPAIGPRGEDDQSKERISSPISPPPVRQSRLSTDAVRGLTKRSLVNPESSLEEKT
jgi:hypothetical protein